MVQFLLVHIKTKLLMVIELTICTVFWAVASNSALHFECVEENNYILFHEPAAQ